MHMPPDMEGTAAGTRAGADTCYAAALRLSEAELLQVAQCGQARRIAADAGTERGARRCLQCLQQLVLRHASS